MGQRDRCVIERIAPQPVEQRIPSSRLTISTGARVFGSSAVTLAARRRRGGGPLFLGLRLCRSFIGLDRHHALLFGLVEGCQQAVEGISVSGEQVA